MPFTPFKFLCRLVWRLKTSHWIFPVWSQLFPALDFFLFRVMNATKHREGVIETSSFEGHVVSPRASRQTEHLNHNERTAQMRDNISLTLSGTDINALWHEMYWVNKWRIRKTIKQCSRVSAGRLVSGGRGLPPLPIQRHRGFGPLQSLRTGARGLAGVW